MNASDINKCGVLSFGGDIQPAMSVAKARWLASCSLKTPSVELVSYELRY